MRICTLCIHSNRAAIDGDLLAGTPLRTIADHWSVSKTALIRHKPHIAERIADAERETGLATIQDVRRRMAALQARVEKLVGKMETGNDHRATLAGLRECREGLRAMFDVLMASDIEARLRRIEELESGK